MSLAWNFKSNWREELNGRSCKNLKIPERGRDPNPPILNRQGCPLGAAFTKLLGLVKTTLLIDK